MGDRIQFKSNSHDVTGYLATPENGPGPGVIVLQEWWGLVPHIEDVVDRFAAAGFTALAPDLYGGETASRPDDAQRLFMAINIEETAKVLQGAVRHLLSSGACSSSRVGAVGFCMGGQMALFAGTVDPSVGAIVDFYGIHPKVQPDYARLEAPVLGLFGATDGSVDPQKVAALEADVVAAGKQITTHTYPGVGHAFFNDTRPEAYDEAAARDAWTRTTTFLREHL